MRKLVLYLGLTLLILSTVVSVKLYLDNQHLLEAFPILIQNERIPSFDVIDTDAQDYSEESLNKGINAVFIFKKPCSFCSDNMLYWGRIARRFTEAGGRVFGVVLGNPDEMFRLKEKVGDEFIPCSPNNEVEFVKNMRIKMNLEQTLIINNGKVAMSKLGALSGNDFIEVIKVFNKLKGKGNEK